MIIMNDDDENDNNERPTHPLASEIQGQLCQALESTMQAHLCMCARLSRCGHLAVIVPLILPRSAVYLFIYLFIYLLISSCFVHLSLSPAESRRSAWPFYSQVEWLCVCSARTCESAGEGNVKGPWPRLQF